jgi:hypothetical protein
MDVTYIPVLAVLRELYTQPRDFERFRKYLEAMLGGTDDVVLPITGANPMAKEHALRAVERLLDLGAEEIAAEAAKEASGRLRGMPGSLKTALVLMDDAMGGWTNRYITEATDRFGGPPPAHRRFATAMVWTTEAPGPDDLRREMLGAIYCVAHKDRYGQPVTLRDMLLQEGRTGAFSGMRPALDGNGLARARAAVTEYAETAGRDDYPVAFACMYGDEGALAAGYPVLGLPLRAGFHVALADTLHAGEDPVAALSG